MSLQTVGVGRLSVENSLRHACRPDATHPRRPSRCTLLPTRSLSRVAGAGRQRPRHEIVRGWPSPSFSATACGLLGRSCALCGYCARGVAKYAGFMSLTLRAGFRLALLALLLLGIAVPTATPVRGANLARPFVL